MQNRAATPTPVRPALAPPRPFQRLQWRLTLSYLATTVLTVLTIAVVLVLAGGYHLFFSRAFPLRVARELRGQVQREVAPLLAADGPPDLARLNRVVEESQRPADPPRRGFEIAVSVRGATAATVIAGRDGHILATAPHDTDFRPGADLGTRLLPVERTLLTAALHGETDLGVLAQRLPNATLATAVPVLRPGTGEVVGVAFFRSRPVFDPRDSLRTVILPVAAILGGVTLFAGLLGGGIGFFTARRLTGRLSAVALAADAWAAGDLAASAPESPPDELGLLAARLNRMARDLTDLIALRQSVATLEERNRLARDLHDTVKQQVFAAAMQVGAARALVGRDPDAAAARLAEAERMAHDVQKELSHVIREMRPVASGASAAAADGEGAPLTARLRAFTEEWSRRTGVAGEFLAGDVPALSPRVAEGLYRVAQEALANVARHSGAATGRVFLSGSRAERTVTLSVTDDGRGFDALEAEAARHTRRDGGGFGLTTMRERAEELPGGAFALTSAPDAGTRIEVRCGVGETGGVS